MCHKVPFNNFDRALKVMQALNRRPGFDLKRIYQCPDCGKWHHTSQEVSKKKRRK